VSHVTGVEPGINYPMVVMLVGAQRLVLEALAAALSEDGGVVAGWCSPDRVADVPAADAWIVEGGEGMMSLLDSIPHQSSVRCYVLDLDDSDSSAHTLAPVGWIGPDFAVADLAALLRCPSTTTGVAPRGGAAPQLSPREIQVLGEIASGATQEAIAGKLSLSTQTVRTHVQNAMVKLGAHSRGEAVSLARERGWLSRDPAPHPQG
jgi:DNA-binding CsgD family transcriptional regulator